MYKLEKQISRPFRSKWRFLLVAYLPILAACGPKEDLDSGATLTEPTPAAPVINWPMTRGGAELNGQVDAEVMRNPQVAWTFASGDIITAEAAILNNRVYVGSEMGILFALNAETGEEIWRFETEDAITSAPTLTDDLVLVGSNDGRLYAIDPETAEERWRFEIQDKISAGAIIVPAPNGEEEWILVNGYDGLTRSLRPEDGSVVWTYETEDFINGSPALVDDQYIVFGGCDSCLHVVGLESGEFVRQIETDAQLPTSVATHGEMAFGANYANQIVAFDIFGGEIAWIYEDRNLPFFSSPAVSEATVFIGSRDKHLHAINREDGTARWKFRTGARIEASPILFRDAVVVGSGDGRLYGLTLDSGDEIWRLELGEALIASPAFGAGSLVVSGDDGTVFAVRDASN